MSFKSILDTLFSCFYSGLKKNAVEFIIKAETTLPGSSGAEKREFVVKKLDELIVLPGLLEAFDGPALGLLVDFLCDKLNLLTDHDKILVAGSEEKAAVVVEAKEEELINPDLSVDEKLEQLYKKYKV